MIAGFSAHLNCLYPTHDAADACSAAATDGFQCVEMWAPPEPDVARRLIARLNQHELSLASINTCAGPAEEDFGLVSAPSSIEHWRDEFLTTLAFARQANARAINVLVGGRKGAATRPVQVDCLIKNLDWALAQLTDGDPVLLIEPLNAADRRSPLLCNIREALSLIARLDDPPNLLILFDAYHLFQEEDDLIESLHLASGRIGHVQVADYPGRGKPGTGYLPVGRFLAELDVVQYDGWVGLEHMPGVMS